MYYSLTTDNLPDDLNPEGLATILEAAAEQARRMSSVRAAHSMALKSCGVGVAHGVLFTARDPEQGGA
jgi:hypothetical protein